jgi:hypothetical protein
VALIFIILVLLGFGVFGTGCGSTGTTGGTTAHPRHHVKCSARMKAQMSAGATRRRCGGPPANP